MSGWLRRWALYVVSWAACGAGITGAFLGGHISRWMFVTWILVNAIWITIARLKDATIRIQDDNLKIVRQHRNSLLQRDRAEWS